MQTIKWDLITSFLFKYLINATLLVSYTKTRLLLIEKCISRTLSAITVASFCLPSYPQICNLGYLMVISNVLIEFLEPQNPYIDTKTIILALILKKISGSLIFGGHLVDHFV